MRIKDIPTPAIYRESPDFRFFLNWFSECLEKVKYDTENLIDTLDPLRCPKELLWLLCDTFGFKYDDRFLPAFNRLVLLYFMSMIYNRGSETGMMIAAETNLAQFNINLYAQENEALSDRLEDTTIPTNSAYVTAHPEEGYIDIVYTAEKLPIDACIEYVRPLGMYCFQAVGLRVDARTKISVDARLANTNALAMNYGPAHVGWYRKNDYAQLQRMVNSQGRPGPQKRDYVYYRNIPYETVWNEFIRPDLRTLYSLQLVNNEHTLRAIAPDTASILSSTNMGDLSSLDVSISYPQNYTTTSSEPMYSVDALENNVEQQNQSSSNSMGTMGDGLVTGSMDSGD